MESYITSEEFQKEVKNVGPDSEYYYRSRYDPVSSSELKKQRKQKPKQ